MKTLFSVLGALAVCVVGCAAVGTPDEGREGSSTSALATASEATVVVADAGDAATDPEAYPCTGGNIGRTLQCKMDYYLDASDITVTATHNACPDNPNKFCSRCTFKAACKAVGTPIGTAGAVCSTIHTRVPAGDVDRQTVCKEDPSYVTDFVIVPLGADGKPSCVDAPRPLDGLADNCHAKNRTYYPSWNLACCVTPQSLAYAIAKQL